MSQSIETLNAYLHQQTPILNSLPVSISIKDVELNYRFFNTASLQKSGFDKLSDIYENSDYEMPWCDQARIFQTGGKKVLSGMSLLTLDPITDNCDRQITSLCHQTPIRDIDNNIIGICLLTKTIAQHKMIDNSRYVTEQDKEGLAEIIRPHLSDKPNYQLNLTCHEQLTLYYLLRGATAEKIAEKLSRSPYTIKDRIDNLKQFFNCTTKAELINTAIRKGYMSLIPEQIKI